MSEQEEEKIPHMGSRSDDSVRSFNIHTESNGSRELTETEVSSLVKDAIRQARKSSRRKSTQSDGSSPPKPPQTPTGLVIAASVASATQSTDLNSPSMSEIDQFLAPTYESGSYRGSSVGGASFNASDDIIRKVEMEIATARKAAKEAHARLANVMSDGHNWESSNRESPATVNDSLSDHLGNLDLRDILSVSSVEGSEGVASGGGSSSNTNPAAEESSTTTAEKYISPKPSFGEDKKTPKDNKSGDERSMEDRSKEQKGDESSAGEQESWKDARTSPDKSIKSKEESVKSPETKEQEHFQMPKAGEELEKTQSVFEDGVELPLDEAAAVLASRSSQASKEEADRPEESSSPKQPPGEKVVDYSPGDLSPESQQHESGDDSSEYTEETVSDGNSEYTEETVEGDDDDGPNKMTIEVGDKSTMEVSKLSLPPETAPERCLSPQETEQDASAPLSPRPWWAVGWFDEDGEAVPTDAAASAQMEGSEAEKAMLSQSSSGPGPAADTLVCCEPTNQSGDLGVCQPCPPCAGTVEASPTKESTGGWSTPGEAKEVQSQYSSDHDSIPWWKREESSARDLASSANGSKAEEVVDEPQDATDPDGALKELAVNNSGSEGGSKVQFRYPYPVPPQTPIPRPPTEILKENTMGTPERKAKWTEPKPELEELLSAVKGDSIARRNNACGALKVLLSKQPKNLFVLVRTVGFLEALVYACGDDIPSTAEREIALSARGRAVTTILKVSEPKENRVLVMTEPGMPECLVKVIQEDNGEPRTHACSALAMLAKTPVNKELMVKVPDLVNVLAKVANGTLDVEEFKASGEEKKEEEESDFEVEVSPRDFASTSFSSAEEDGTLPEEDGLSAGESGSISSGARSPNMEGRPYKPESIRRKKDGQQTEFVLQSKLNACAALLHLSKHCAVSDKLCENKTLMDSMMTISRDFDSPIHTKCIEILCNLTRFPANNNVMAKNSVLVETFVKCGKSKKVDDRVWALRGLQNIAGDSKSKLILAKSSILTLLSICAMRKTHSEQEAAVATLYNLSTDPGAVVPLTNTRNVVATLVHLAHHSATPAETRRMSCEALARIGLWLQTLAGSGTIPEEFSGVLLPTHKTNGWQRWE